MIIFCPLLSGLVVKIHQRNTVSDQEPLIVIILSLISLNLSLKIFKHTKLNIYIGLMLIN